MFWRAAHAARSHDVVAACEAIDDLEGTAMHAEGRVWALAFALIQDAASKGAKHPLRVCARVALDRLNLSPDSYPAD